MRPPSATHQRSRLRICCAPLLALLVSVSCSSKSPTTSSDRAPTIDAPAAATSTYESGALYEEYQYFLENNERILHGSYRAFYESGPVEMTGFYARGLKDSTWSFFASDGSKTLEHRWKEGRRWSGPFSLYWPNGQLSEYGLYRNGQWHGAYISYYQSGQTEIRTQYINDQLSGPYVEFYENGERKLTGLYSDGFKSGLWTRYDESGNITLRESYEDGQLTQVEQTLVETYDDGQIKSTAPLTDGQIDGVYSEYWPNGARKEETVYRRGVTHGASSIYWDNGQLRETGINSIGKKQGVWQTFTRGGILSIRATYSQGLLTGSYVSYYPSGQIQWQGVYDKNMKDGLWTNFTSAGEKRLQQLWENNRLVNGIDCSADANACQ